MNKLFTTKNHHHSEPDASEKGFIPKKIDWDKPDDEQDPKCCPFEVGCIIEEGVLVGKVFAEVDGDAYEYMAFFSDSRPPIKDYEGPWEVCPTPVPLIPISLHCY